MDRIVVPHDAWRQHGRASPVCRVAQFAWWDEVEERDVNEPRRLLAGALVEFGHEIGECRVVRLAELVDEVIDRPLREELPIEASVIAADVATKS